MELIPIILIGVLYVICAYACFQKGKTTFGWLTLAGLIPFLAPLGIFGLVGALRYAKPNSAWAHARYSPSEMEASHRRFPSIRPPTPSSAVASGLTAPGTVTEDVPRPDDSKVIRRFVGRAHDAGIIDADTQLRLIDFLNRSRAVAETPVPVERDTAVRSSAPAPPSVEPPVPIPTPSPEASVPVVRYREPPVSAPVTPPAPPVPNPVRSFISDTWDAIASDVALHGFAYLGVAVTFIGVLGFLLFAFADLPDEAQPFVELFIALIFFGWAWVLRRQQAEHVADGMELIGGMVLPLILFAGLVDNAPIPPDFTGGGLVVALTVCSLLLAVAYALVSKLNPESALRYLVAPLVWLGAMTFGFAFKTDELLASDAITRLVSPQPALAAAAISLTLLACLARPEHRLAAPTVRSSLIGAPAAYLLTVSLAAGEDWSLLWPLVVLGAATLVSAEILAIWFDRRELMGPARPILLAGALAPMEPTLGVGWTGLTVVVSYIALYEWGRRRVGPNTTSQWLSVAGVGVGLALSLDQPWAALASFTLASVWTQFRRFDEPGGDSAQVFAGAAALLPIGVVFALDRLYGGTVAWLVMSGVVASVAIAVRWLGSDDPFWDYWIPSAAIVIGIGAAAYWWDAGRDDPRSAVTLLVVSVAIGIGRRWPIARVWMTIAMASGALAMVLEAAGTNLELQQGLWAALGLTLVVAAMLWRRSPAAHLAAAGHIMASGAALSLLAGGDSALVLGLWSLGWVASTVAEELGGDTVTALLAKVAAPTDGGASSRAEIAARWVVPVMAVATAPLALITIANHWDEFAAHRSWTGVLTATVAVLYASGTRWHRLDRVLRLTLATGAVVASVIGVSVAAPDSWPTIYAAVGVLGVASLLSRDLRSTWFVWFAWFMTVVLVLLLADRAGVPGSSLHVVSLIWGGVMMVGGLVIDDFRSGRRRRGEGLRTDWLRYPVLLGALVVPVSLGPALINAPDTYAWWALGAAAAYMAVALLIRVGTVTAPAYALAALGMTALSPRPLTADPWLFVLLATPLLAVSWLTARRQQEPSNVWLRWDLPPLVVAHGIAVVALAFAWGDDRLAPTAFAFGLLSAGISLWRRQRGWEEAANLLILVAAWDLGAGWLALALAATSIRGVVRAALAEGVARPVYQGLSVVSAGLAWLSFLDWTDLSAPTALHTSVLTFGAMTLVVALLARWAGMSRDTTYWWGALGVAGVCASVAVAVAPIGPGIEGLWVAAGLVLMSVGFEIGWKATDFVLRYLAVVGAGASWLFCAVGAGWDPTTTAQWSSLVFGVLTVGVSLAARWSLGSADGSESRSLGLARAWVGLGAGGVVVAALSAYELGDLDVAGYWVAGGLALMSLGLALGAHPLRIGVLRDASGLASLAALLLGSVSAGWSDFSIATTILLVAASSTLASLWLWRGASQSAWIRPLVALGSVANLIAAALAVGQLPARGLSIAVLVAVGVQAIAVGLVREAPGVLAIGPPLLGAAFILSVVESVGGSAQWYTAPLGLVLLSEVEILRRLPRFAAPETDRSPIVVLEWVALGILAAPPLVEMFTTTLYLGLLALAVAVAVFIWGVVTRVRRRVVAAASLAMATLVLLIFAAAAGSAPESAFFWIVAVGIGFSVMLVAGLLEAYRSKRGRAMSRIDQLMAGWE